MAIDRSKYPAPYKEYSANNAPIDEAYEELIAMHELPSREYADNRLFAVPQTIFRRELENPPPPRDFGTDEYKRLLTLLQGAGTRTHTNK